MAKNKGNAEAENAGMVKIKATKSLVGRFGIGCLSGEECEVTEAQADDIIGAGFGVLAKAE